MRLSESHTAAVNTARRNQTVIPAYLANWRSHPGSCCRHGMRHVREKGSVRRGLESVGENHDGSLSLQSLSPTPEKAQAELDDFSCARKVAWKSVYLRQHRRFARIELEGTRS